MNQEKIGKHIAECRKKCNLTQEQLAEKIGVSSKSISRWENGKTMPDVSLFNPLCEELGITINELLSGEKINEKNYQKKLEENILNTINYTDKKIKKNNKKLKLILIMVITLILVFITLFIIDLNRMKNNKPVFFSTWGFKYSPPINIEDEKIKIAINKYLVEKSDTVKHHDNEKSFVSMKVYLLEEKKESYNVYAWVLEEKYYLEDNEIKQDSGSSIPYKFVVKLINNEYKVIDSRIPRDGTYYIEDMKNIFPKYIRINMEKVHDDGTIKRLSLDILEQVKLYFHK